MQSSEPNQEVIQTVWEVIWSEWFTVPPCVCMSIYKDCSKNNASYFIKNYNITRRKFLAAKHYFSNHHKYLWIFKIHLILWIDSCEELLWAWLFTHIAVTMVEIHYPTVCFPIHCLISKHDQQMSVNINGCNVFFMHAQNNPLFLIFEKDCFQKRTCLKFFHTFHKAESSN